MFLETVRILASQKILDTPIALYIFKSFLDLPTAPYTLLQAVKNPR